MSRVAIIGAGLSGLVAAHDVRHSLGPTVVIDVYESSDRVGGLLYDVPVAGRSTDVGAEAFILRRPEARELVTELGLDDELVVPTGARPAVWARGRLNSLPTPAWMGIPASVESVRDLVEDGDVARMLTEAQRPLSWTPGADCSLGELVADRFGPSVVSRCVDPMIGGVYACLAVDTGVRAAMPALARLLDDGVPSLTAAVGALLPPPDATPTSVFGALRGGYRRLVDALVASAAAHVHLDHGVEQVTRSRHGWSVDGQDYDAVIVATPAPVAASQLSVVAPDSAQRLAGIATASTAVVAMAVDPTMSAPDYSGVLAATGEELASRVCANPVKAITFSSHKWAHYAGDGAPLRVRASVGRLGEPVTATDEQLRATAAAALAQVAGTATVVPLDAVVQRWPAGLPCYAPGHDALISTVMGDLPTGIAVAGSAYRGVGVPACIGSARAAAAAAAGHLSAL